MKTILALVLIVSIASTASAQLGGIVATKSSGFPSENLHGINVNFVSEFAYSHVFGDLMRHTQLRSENHTSHDIALSSPPQTDLANISGSASSMWCWPQNTTGVYTVHVRKISDYDQAGSGTIEITPAGQSKITFTADGTFTFNAPEVGTEGVTLFTITANDGDTRFAIYAPGANIPGPGDDPDDIEFKFHPTFVKALLPYGCLRSLNWQRINRRQFGNLSDPIVTLATDIVPYDRISQADVVHGANVGHFLDLCTAANADAWVLFPHSADNTIITDIVTRCWNWKQANPGRKIYFEISNEVWNSVFAQSYVADSGHALYPYAAHTIGGNIDPGADFTNRIAKGYGRMAADMFDEIDAVSLTGWSNAEYIEVFAWHGNGGTAIPNVALDQFVADRNGGKIPERYAIADYLSWRNNNIQSDSRKAIIETAITAVTGTTKTLSQLTAQEVFDVDAHLTANYGVDYIVNMLATSPNQGLAYSLEAIQDAKTVATARGIPQVIRYEHNQHLATDIQDQWAGRGTYVAGESLRTWAQEYVRAAFDPRMKPIIEHSLRQWHIHAGDTLSCHFMIEQSPNTVDDLGEFDRAQGNHSQEHFWFGVHSKLLPEPDETPASKAIGEALKRWK